jgi:hypothetical protein
VLKESNLEDSIRLHLNVTWHPRKKHLEETTDHLVEVGPEGGPPQPDRLGGGAGWPPLGATSALLPEGSSIVYEDQSKPLVRSV